MVNTPSPKGKIFEMINCGRGVNWVPCMEYVKVICKAFTLNNQLKRIFKPGCENGTEEPRRWKK